MFWLIEICIGIFVHILKRQHETWKYHHTRFSNSCMKSGVSTIRIKRVQLYREKQDCFLILPSTCDIKIVQVITELQVWSEFEIWIRGANYKTGSQSLYSCMCNYVLACCINLKILLKYFKYYSGAGHKWNKNMD